MLRTMFLFIAIAVVLLPCCISYRISMVPTKSPKSSAALFQFKEGGKIGYLDARGNVAIPAQFGPMPDYEGDFFEGLARARLDGQDVFINESGQVVFALDRSHMLPARDFHEGLAAYWARENENSFSMAYGFLDKSGNVAIRPQFQSVGDFSEGMASYREATRKLGGQTHMGRSGYIDRSGQIVIPPQFAAAHGFSEGLARVAFDGACQFNNTTAPLLPLKSECGRPLPGMQTCEQGFIDKVGQPAFPGRFANAQDFREGLAAVEIGGKWGFIDKIGAVVIQPQFESVQSFSEGLAAAKLDGRWGYIDRTGQLKIPHHYDWASDFRESLAKVTIGEVGLYIHSDGSIAFSSPTQFSGSFVFGLAGAQVNSSNFAYIDKTGRIVREFAR